MEKIKQFIENHIYFGFCDIQGKKSPVVQLERHDYCELIKMLEKYSNIEKEC